MENKILLYEQTDLMLGNKKYGSSVFFEKDGTNNERAAISFIRYSVNVFYGYNQNNGALENVTVDDLLALNLGRILAYVIIPPYVLPRHKNKYLIDKIFKNDFSEEEWATNYICSQIKSGEITKIPKYYMTPEKQDLRSILCLRRFIKEDFPNKSVFELYQMSATHEFEHYLKSRLLLAASKNTYETSVDYLDASLPDEQKDVFLKNIYKVIYKIIHKFAS